MPSNIFDTDHRGSGGFPIKKMVGAGGIVVVALILLALSGSIFETNQAGYLQVKQAAWTGEMTCRVEPGTYIQGFGDIYTYPEAETFAFTAPREALEDDDVADGTDRSLPTRFNDGTKSQVSGSLRVILPKDCPSLIQVHRKFHDKNGVMGKLVLPAVQKTLFSTGPHMSAGESYAERRSEFASLAEDQLHYGVIRVETHEEERPDAITGEMKTVSVLDKLTCDTEGASCVGGFQREGSAFAEFGISITNFVIDGIEYPREVLDQIEVQRAARMNVITQQAEAKEADARASKAEAEARAQIAETRAKEEVRKTELIVQGEAAREQARLAKEAAEYYKQDQILRGQGEAERKRLVLNADGALEAKLKAYLEVNKMYADAMKGYQGSWVPSIVMGESNGGGNGAQSMIDLLSAKTAKELSLDMSVRGNTRSGNN